MISTYYLKISKYSMKKIIFFWVKFWISWKNNTKQLKNGTNWTDSIAQDRNWCIIAMVFTIKYAEDHISSNIQIFKNFWYVFSFNNSSNANSFQFISLSNVDFISMQKTFDTKFNTDSSLTHSISKNKDVVLGITTKQNDKYSFSIPSTKEILGK